MPNAQIGISGSVKIGKNLIGGGQTGFAGHLNIGDNVRIAAKVVLLKTLRIIQLLVPATDIKSWRLNIVNERKNRHK